VFYHFTGLLSTEHYQVMSKALVDICGNTDSHFFCPRLQISTKTGSLRFGNK
jgi:hypothetical protein